MVYKISDNCEASATQAQQADMESIYSLQNVPVEIKEEEELIIDDIDDSNVRWCFIGGLDDDDEEDEIEDKDMSFKISPSTTGAMASSCSFYEVQPQRQLLPIPVQEDDVIEITDEEDDIYDSLNNSFSSCNDDIGVVNEPLESSFCIGYSGIGQELPKSEEFDKEDRTDSVVTMSKLKSPFKSNMVADEVKDGNRLLNDNNFVVGRRTRRSKGLNGLTLLEHSEENQCVTAVKDLLARKYMKIKCHICGETFSFSPYNWLKHIRDLHQSFYAKMLAAFRFQTENLAFCILCKLNINSKVNHMFHYIWNHCEESPSGIEIFVCTICGHADASIFDLKQHQKETHAAEEKANSFSSNDIKAEGVECPKCRQIFKNNAAIELHFFSEHSREFWGKFRYSCHLCVQTFEGCKKNYLEHMMNVHKLNNWKALKLRKFDNGQYLQCSECLKIFTKIEDTSKLLAHFLIHQENCFWSCKFCEATNRFQELPAMHLCTSMKNFYHHKHSHKANEAAMEESKDAIRKISSWNEFEVYVKHVCPFCKYEFEHFDEWRQHVREIHHINTLEGLNMSPIPGDEDQLQCMECLAQVTKSAVELHKHRFQHLPFMPYLCRQCLEPLATYSLALNHALQGCCEENADLSTNHKETLVAAQTNKVYKLKTEPEYATPHSYLSYCCPLCNNKKFPDLEALTKHFRIVHNNFQQYFTKASLKDVANKTMCKICRNLLNSNISGVIVPHYFHHLDEKPFRCRKCNRTFSLHKRAMHHVKSYHYNSSDMPAELEIKQEKEAYQLRSVKKEQDKEKAEKSRKSLIKTEEEVEAKISRKALKRGNAAVIAAVPKTKIKSEIEDDPTKSVIKNELLESDRTIAAENSEDQSFFDANAKLFQEFKDFIAFACPECNKSFKSLHLWERHIKTQHSFFKASQLSVSDAKTGQLKCPDCQLVLREHISRQRRHRLTHLPHASFVCTICKMRSTQICSMYIHMRNLHFAQTSQKCPLCSKVFKTPYAKSLHMKESHARRSWPKDMCVLCFLTVDEMGSHIQKNHLVRKKNICEICGISFAKGLEQHMASKHPKGKVNGVKRKLSPSEGIVVAAKLKKKSDEIKTNGRKSK
uniref:C2H2-type domain-containing protein n=1 Tax=Stomoxys calcitrans TaxID=35570 RepID=A0A1I8P458_STOCA